MNPSRRGCTPSVQEYGKLIGLRKGYCKREVAKVYSKPNRLFFMAIATVVTDGKGRNPRWARCT